MDSEEYGSGVVAPGPLTGWFDEESDDPCSCKAVLVSLSVSEVLLLLQAMGKRTYDLSISAEKWLKDPLTERKGKEAWEVLSRLLARQQELAYWLELKHGGG